jgi:hypothetical protein
LPPGLKLVSRPTGFGADLGNRSSSAQLLQHLFR